MLVDENAAGNRAYCYATWFDKIANSRLLIIWINQTV
jgi:hypothetical protein